MRRLLFITVVTWVLLVQREAFAFCRTTTCTCASEATCDTDCPKDEYGCPSKGRPLVWKGACTGFALSVAGTSTLTEDQWTDAIVQAFDAWTGVDCGDGEPPSIDLIQLRNVSCNESQYNSSGPNVNVIYFDDNGWSGTGIDGTLAATTVTFSDSGQILDADMAINSARHDFSITDEDVQTDLVSVVTHEVGHFLGIAHSPLPDAVMFADYTPGTIKRTLTPDDVAAICAIYPPQRSAGVCDPTPQGGLETTCGNEPAAGCSVSRRSGNGDNEALFAFLLGAVGLVGTRGVLKRWRGQ
jgi:matrixin